MSKSVGISARGGVVLCWGLILAALAAGLSWPAAAASAAGADQTADVTHSSGDASDTASDQPDGSTKKAPLAELEEVVVTGSRIARPGFDSPNPVTVLSGQEAEKLGLTTAGDVVAELPQNSAFVSNANVGAGNFNIGSQLANLRGLNPFFGTRTLTLVDTKRFVPTTDGGAVDLNVIPSMLIERVETVTGGASAAYGSDAVAGVVNIILNKKLDGFKVQVDGGQTAHNDGQDYHASVAYGTNLGDRAHMIIGAEYERANSVGGCQQVRDWCESGYAQFTNPDYVATPAGALYPGSPAIPANGLPHYIVGPNARNYNSTTGLFPLLNVQFNPAGTALVPYTAGNYATAFGFTPMQGGADAGEDYYNYYTLRPLVKHFSSFTHVDADLTDNLSAYLEGSFAGKDATNTQANTGASVFYNSIQPDNAYLPASAAPYFALGPQPFNSDGSVLPPVTNDTQTRTGRLVAGLNGKLTGTWAWDAYYTFGRNTTHEAIANSQVNSFMAYALDAVAQTPGLPVSATNPVVCRSTDPAYGPVNPAAAGCVPLDLFGVGNASPAAIAYAYRTLHQDEIYDQHVLAGSIHGDVFPGWGGGPIGFAGGVEFRRETADVTHDQQQQPWYAEYARGYGSDYHARQDIFEGFAEVNVPLLKDVPLIKALSVDGAVRETSNKATDETDDSSNTVDFTTWKLSGVWNVNDWVRFRATRSRDVRAPSFYELYAQSTQIGGFFGTVTNPNAGNAMQSLAATLGGSTSSLKPEQADTLTAGIVFSGQNVLEGLQASADWYQIDLNGPISTLGSAQAVVTACATEHSYCNLLSGTGAVAGGGYTNLTAVAVPDLNLGSYITRGVDLETDYNLPLDRVHQGWLGNFSVRLIGSYLYDMLINTGTGAPVYNYAGVSGPTAAFGYFNTSPKFQGNGFFTYSVGPFSSTAQVRYISSGKYQLLDPVTGLPLVTPGEPGYNSTLSNSINENHVDSATYVNLSVAYEITRSLQLFGVVNNVFNKAPPLAPGGNGYPTNPVYFDTYGTAWKLGVRLQF
jgi:iron complex outermembrane recepter protein